jgi:hypothetical protein
MNELSAIRTALWHRAVAYQPRDVRVGAISVRPAIAAYALTAICARFPLARAVPRHRYLTPSETLHALASLDVTRRTNLMMAIKRADAIKIADWAPNDEWDIAIYGHPSVIGAWIECDLP